MGELGPERLLLVIMQCMPCEVKEAASRTPSCTEKRSVKKDARRSVVPRFMVSSFSSKPFGRGRLRVGHHAAKRTTSSRGTGQEKPNTKASTSPEVISLRVGLKTRMLKMYFIMHSRCLKELLRVRDSARLRVSAHDTNIHKTGGGTCTFLCSVNVNAVNYLVNNQPGPQSDATHRPVPWK